MSRSTSKQGAGTIFLLSMLVVAARCHDGEDDIPKPEVHANLQDVQIVPGAEGASRTFPLSAWYQDSAGNAVPGPALGWWSDLNGASVEPATGSVSISGFPGAGSSAGTVQVGSSGYTADTVKLTLWASAAAARAGGDVVGIREQPPATAGPANRPADPPSIALLESRTSDQCEWGRPLAFVGALSVGEQDSVPCGLALFFPRHGMLFQDPVNDAGWLKKGARFSLKPGKPLPVRITVFLAVTQYAPAGQETVQEQENERAPSPRELAELDVQRANLIFETSRAGIQIDAEYKPLPLTSDLQVRLGADPYDCVEAFDLPSDPTKDDYAYNPYRISVYYVDRINYPLDPVHPRVRGIQCHHWYSGNPLVGSPPGRGPVVFISYSHHSPVTLAHELGHALGLNDEEGRLGNRDVMHNLLPDGPLGADARSHLTVGQAFRLNVWDDSWINTRTPRPLRRACDAVQPCPDIESDPDD